MSFLSGNSPSVQIRSGGKEVLVTGIVHTFDRRNIEIQLEELAVVFEFLEDEGQTRADSKPTGPRSILLQLYNFKSALGNGLIDPIEIGTFRHRKLYLAFTAFCAEPKSIRRLEYTFFVGDPLKGGKGAP